jgi:hypothetical protein
VTAHGIPIGPLQFDRLKGILDRQVHIRNSENVGKTTEENLVADRTATLIEQDGLRQGAKGHKMAKDSDEGNGGRADVDLSESSVYGNGQTELESDDVATADLRNDLGDPDGRKRSVQEPGLRA